MAKYVSRAHLMAQHEADQARIAGLMVENKTFQRRIQELKDALAVANQAPQTLLGPKALMAEAKRLAELGTACYVRGHHIYDAKSREVIV